MGKATAPVFVTTQEEEELQTLRAFLNSDAGKKFQGAYGGVVISRAVRLAGSLVNLMGLWEKVPDLPKALVWKPEDLPSGVDPDLLLVIDRFMATPAVVQTLHGLPSYTFSMDSLTRSFNLEQQLPAETPGKKLLAWVKKAVGRDAAADPGVLGRMPVTAQFMALCYFYSHVVTNRILNEPQCLLFIVSDPLFQNVNEYLRLSLVRQNVVKQEVLGSENAGQVFITGTPEEMKGLALCLEYYDAKVQEAKAGGIPEHINLANTTGSTARIRSEKLIVRAFQT